MPELKVYNTNLYATRVYYFYGIFLLDREIGTKVISDEKAKFLIDQLYERRGLQII